jgi:hypothetical protein
MSQQTRRVFLQRAVGTATLGAVVSRFARADVYSQIRVTVVGLNGRGRDHIAGLQNNIVALCDCD